MAIVVSDTSPVRALAHLLQLDLLRKLFAEVLVPPAVAHELANPAAGLPAVNVATVPYLRVVSPQSTTRFPALSNLDIGEAEALALAMDVRADAVLLDERRGRRAATSLGLKTVGLIAVLVQAKQAGIVPQAIPLIDRLRTEINFFVSDELREWARSRIGE